MGVWREYCEVLGLLKPRMLSGEWRVEYGRCCWEAMVYGMCIPLFLYYIIFLRGD